MELSDLCFTETQLKGAFIVDLVPIPDRRGFFAYAYSADIFEAHGLKPTPAQIKLAYNHTRGTFRGLHYQIAPATEAKFVRCTRGAILDIIIDMRPESSTYLKHIGIELSAENRRALYVPEMFAHGYQTLSDDTEVAFQVSEPYTPDCERGLHHADPALAITLPLAVTEISDRDAAWPYLSARRSGRLPEKPWAPAEAGVLR